MSELVERLESFDPNNWPVLKGRECEICGQPAQCSAVRSKPDLSGVMQIYLCQKCAMENQEFRE